jgi:hypothetical protein
MRFAIRAGRNDDWDVMRDIFAQAGEAAWGHILSASTLANLPAPDRWRPHGGADVLVAECAGEVVGFVCLRGTTETIGLCGSTALPDGGSMALSGAAPFKGPSCWNSAIG